MNNDQASEQDNPSTTNNTTATSNNSATSDQTTTTDTVTSDTEYHGTQERLGGEFRYDFRPHTRFGVGFLQYLTTPAEREEWVSAQDGTQWYQEAELLEEAWSERGARTAYDPGERTEQTWFSAVVQPRLGEGYWTPNRQGDYLQVNLPSWAGDDPTHTGALSVFDEFLLGVA